MYYAGPNGIQSYIAGVNLSDWFKEAMESRNAENQRLGITSSQEDYFKKQRLMQEAINQLKSTGVVSPEITKEIDINALKKSLEGEDSGESSATSMLSGNESKSQISAKNSTLNAGYQSLKEKLLLSKTTQSQEQEKVQETKQENKSPILVQASFLPPENIDSKAASAFNPLEIDETSEISQNSVSFIDEVSGKKVNVPLSEENAKNLIEKFGSLEAASDYVKGWYYDAAYTAGYLENDIDGDGKINLDEGIHLKNLVSLITGKHSSFAESLPLDTQAQKKLLETLGYEDNIADFINKSIARDKNFDSNLSLDEMFEHDKELVAFKISASFTSITEGNFSATSLSFDILVIQRSNFDFTQDFLSEFLQNLFNNQNSQENDSNKSQENPQESLELLDNESLQEILNNLTAIKNKAFLEHLNPKDFTSLQKSQTIFDNLLQKEFI